MMAAVSFVKRQTGQRVIKVRGIDPGNSHTYGKVFRRSYAAHVHSDGFVTAVNAHPGFELMADYTI